MKEPHRTDVSGLSVSAAGVRFIKRWEGLYLRSYYCPAGVLTIGYGHTNLSGTEPKVTPHTALKNEAEAESILKNDLRAVYEPVIKRHVKVPLSQGEYDALVSWVFNLGEENFRKSTLLKKINRRQYDLVPAELMKWVYADTRNGRERLNGLVNRRRGESALWRSMSSTISDPPIAIQVPTPIGPAPDIIVPRARVVPPSPEPLTPSDHWIERIGILTPVLSVIAGVADWKVAAVIAGAGTMALGFFMWKNRTED